MRKHGFAGWNTQQVTVISLFCSSILISFCPGVLILFSFSGFHLQGGWGRRDWTSFHRRRIGGKIWGKARERNEGTYLWSSIKITQGTFSVSKNWCELYHFHMVSKKVFFYKFPCNVKTCTVGIGNPD